jgi:L-iditol 2-dehydrogenase
MAEKGKMKAALLYGPKDVRVEEVDIPPLSDSEVLVKVKSIGVCQSDVRSYLGIYKRQLFPPGRESYGLSGHEWSGEVVEVGKSVKGFSAQDRVVPEIILSCGLCKFCAKGMTNLCRNKTFINRGYAEYAKAPAQHLMKVPQAVSYEQAAFAEPIAVCLHTNDLVSPKPGDIVLIVGAGPMGLIHTQITKLSGASVIVSEILESRRSMAKQFGADFTINPSSEDLPSRVKELTEGNGADAVICATGARRAIEDAIPAVGSGGRLVLFGGTYPPERIQIDPNIIHYGEICITGSYDHLPIHMHRALQLLNSRKIEVMSLISDTLSLERVKQAFELAMNSTALKVLVKP